MVCFIAYKSVLAYITVIENLRFVKGSSAIEKTGLILQEVDVVVEDSFGVEDIVIVGDENDACSVEDEFFTAVDELFTAVDELFTIVHNIFTVEHDISTAEDEILTVEDEILTAGDDIISEDDICTAGDDIISEDDICTVGHDTFTVEHDIFTSADDVVTTEYVSETKLITVITITRTAIILLTIFRGDILFYSTLSVLWWD